MTGRLRRLEPGPWRGLLGHALRLIDEIHGVPDLVEYRPSFGEAAQRAVRFLESLPPS